MRGKFYEKRELGDSFKKWWKKIILNIVITHVKVENVTLIEQKKKSLKTHQFFKISFIVKIRIPMVSHRKNIE